jgi:hypothetical protein
MALLLLPPAFGYTVVFHVAPWVLRGFKSTTQGLQGSNARPT